VRPFPDEQLSKVLHAAMSRGRLFAPSSNECRCEQTIAWPLTEYWESPD